MTKYLLLLLTLSICDHCWGQRKLLMLQKKNSNKNAYYEPGDEMAFRKRGSGTKITGNILDLKDSIVVFNGFEIRTSEIASIYIDEKTKWWLRFKIEQLCFYVGGLYLGADFINTGKLSDETLLISGTILGAGLLAKIVVGNRIKIRGKTKLRVLLL